MSVPGLSELVLAAGVIVALGATLILSRRLRRDEREAEETTNEVARRLVLIEEHLSALDKSSALLRGEFRQLSETTRNYANAVSQFDRVDGVVAHKHDIDAVRRAQSTAPRPSLVTGDDSAAPQFSPELVTRLYRSWCIAKEPPKSTSTTEVVYMRHEKTKREGDLAKPVHLLRETKQPAEFVRFAAAGSNEALLLPNPHARFSAVTNYLFPVLDSTSYSRKDTLAGLQPVRVNRTDEEGTWQASI